MVEYDDEKGAIFSMSKDSDAPTKASEKYIFFGELECTVQAAPGKGIITAIVLQSDDLDEIDWEWVGAEKNEVQSNYFSKGDDSTWDRVGFHDVDDVTGQFHTYGLVWTPEKIDWNIDGNTIRTLKASDAGGGKKFPQSPMQIKLGTWVAGRKDAPEGTVEWGGGRADWSNGASNGYFQSCKIVDYMGGEDAATSYHYPANYDGMWESIEVINDANSDSSTTASSATATATTTSTRSTASTTATASTTTASESHASTTTASESHASTTGTETTITTAVSSIAAEPSSAVSDEESATTTEGATATSDTDEEAASASEGADAGDDEPVEAAGVATRASFILGAAGLLAAFVL